MQAIETELNVGGFALRQIARDGLWAVYEQSKGGKVTSFELIRIQVAKAREIFDKSYPEREVYPSNEAWGKDAWTITDRTEAIHRMHRNARIPSNRALEKTI